ncbi:hypothetical protein PSCLAVI8L_220002 [Pseudoclavibacter sp. 8L]|nr:hypothetical protein PSCLAVI8L_220002 [Pseudoclavibacter sp. 8L]
MQRANRVDPAWVDGKIPRVRLPKPTS